MGFGDVSTLTVGKHQGLSRPGVSVSPGIFEVGLGLSGVVVCDTET